MTKKKTEKIVEPKENLTHIDWNAALMGDLGKYPIKTPAKPPSKKSKPKKKPAKKLAKKTNKKKITATKKRVPSKKSTTRKCRTDSISLAVETAQASLREINPPDNVYLQEDDLKHWDSIIAEFAKVDWTDHTLELAAMLATNMRASVAAMRRLDKEGITLQRKQVIPATSNTSARVVILSVYANPVKSFLDMYNKNIIAFRRSLSLHARGQEGETRDVAKRRAAAKEIENSFVDDDDDLLARPKSLH